MKELETPTAETICLELSTKNKKWFILFAYRPESINRSLFFEEMNVCLSKAFDKYQNIVLIGDLNIDVNIQNHDTNHFLSDLYDSFDLTNMVKEKTCFMSQLGSSIDIISTNKPKSFFKSYTIETGLSDHHKMIITFLRIHNSIKLKSKNIVYRDVKNMDFEKFENDVKNIPIDELHRFPDPFEGYTTFFKSILDRHAPIKTKIIRGNNKRFMNKELSKALKDKSRIKNKFNKWRSRENYRELQEIKKKCKYLTFKAEKDHIERVLSKGFLTNKDFWKHFGPALSEKYSNTDIDIVLKEGDEMISEDSKIAEIFNEQYINIIENTTGTAPDQLRHLENLDTETMNRYIKDVIDKFENHPSILKIKEHVHQVPTINIPLATTEDVDNILKKINTKKSAGPDLILPCLVKKVKHIINDPIRDLINDMISNKVFPNSGKIAHVTPAFKPDKDDRNEKSNFRPLSGLGTFSKILERYLHNKISIQVDHFLSMFISAYRKKHSTNHVLIRLIETWKLKMDSNKVVGAVLMDLSKAFDCIPHDLLIAKMHAYGFDEDSLILFFSYLKDRKQAVKVNNTLSSFMTLVSGVPQGSILGPLLFNIFINDIVFFLERSDLGNYADDNTITAWENSIKELINTLQNESNIAIDWFRENQMIVNPDKFQVIIFHKQGKTIEDNYTLSFGQYQIPSKNSVSLLGIEIDNKLSFKNYICSLIRKAAGQLNYLISKKNLLTQECKLLLIDSFLLANFNYCPLVWLFCNKALKQKQENIQKRALRFLYEDYESDYDTLLQRANKPTIELRKLRFLAIEIFKTINDLNPQYMKEIFTLNTRETRDSKLIVKSQNTKKYGNDTLRSLGPKIWNKLPQNIKEAKNLNTFKTLIKTWSGPTCSCSNCS